MSARLLLIGLDGADGRTLDRASGDGTLPVLAALRARGAAWGLGSARGATDDALWASFQYGAEVGEHGRYSYQLDDGGGQSGFAIARETERATFWDRLSRRHLRVAVLDVPKCRTPRPLNGIHLTDWLVHGRYVLSGPLAYPEGLAGEVVARFGAAPPSLCAYHPPVLSDDGVRAARDALVRSVAQKRAAGLHFLAAEPWDLFVIGFKEAHCGCHMFWDFADPAHAKHDAARAARLGNPVLDILRAQDAAIGDLVAAAGRDATVIVFSTTDFAPNGSILHLLPEIVARVNRYVGAQADDGGVPALLRSLRPGAAPPACRSVFYSDNAVALRVPRRGFETARRYRQRLDLIADLLCDLTDAEDGRPVVSAVTRPAFEHAGRRAASLPHLLFHVRRDVCPGALLSARLGRIEAPPPANIRSGNHEAGGFALAVGPAAGAAAARVKSMADFAALAETILAGRAQTTAAAG